MATLLKNVTDNIISMEFNENPNLPTANYSDDTAKNIKKAIIKKMRTEKLKRLIDQELKKEIKIKTGESLGIPLTFKGM